jgi:3-phosphoshikimate 1-carboxyvinyltransferase
MSQHVPHFPDRLAITPLERAPFAVVHVPGSKSITNRALVLAALAGQECELREVLRSEDTEVMVAGLTQLGFGIEPDWNTCSIRVARRSSKRAIPAESADLFVANSGTSMRFLTALASLGHGRYRLDGVPRMRERPIEDLLAALRELGVKAHSEKNNGCPPVVIEADGLAGGQVHVRGDVSSQFLSGLMMAAPAARSDLTLHVTGPAISWPYVLMTANMLVQFRAEIEQVGDTSFRIRAPQNFGVEEYFVEEDASAASYFAAAAAITWGEVSLAGFGGDAMERCNPRGQHWPLPSRGPAGFGSLQGDTDFLNLLVRMGCELEFDDHVTIRGGPLRGIDADMNDISDTVMTLAAVACFAEGPTTIRNVAHIRHKETDRLAALATELRRVGAGVEEFADGLTITPAPLHGAVIQTYNDHRIAMSLALLGLRVPGIVIDNPACVTKTYPGFFQDLEQLRCDA